MLATIDTDHGRFERANIPVEDADALWDWLQPLAGPFVYFIVEQTGGDAVTRTVRVYIRASSIRSVAVLEEE